MYIIKSIENGILNIQKEPKLKWKSTYLKPTIAYSIRDFCKVILHYFSIISYSSSYMFRYFHLDLN